MDSFGDTEKEIEFFQRGFTAGYDKGLWKAKEIAMDAWSVAHEEGFCKDSCEWIAKMIENEI